MKQFLSLSGGKDSTAMLLMMLERGERVDAAVYFDTGEWEFPEMAEHLARLEAMVAPVPVVRLHPRKPFTWFMLHKEVWSRGTDEARFVGWGWPSPLRRWCTREKARTIDKFVRAQGGGVQVVGYAADEARRTQTKNMQARREVTRFPLIEWDITEADALDYCRAQGFDWGGLYDIFPRVSCFCCPLQSLGELRKLRRHYPNLWDKMLDWESQMTREDQDRRFNHEATVHDLEERFSAEEATAHA